MFNRKKREIQRLNAELTRMRRVGHDSRRQLQNKVSARFEYDLALHNHLGEEFGVEVSNEIVKYLLCHQYPY